MQEIPALDHEVRDYAVEFGTLVALGFAKRGFGRASAEGEEVLGGFGDGVVVELD